MLRKHDKLDLANVYTTLGFSWQALIKTAIQYCEHGGHRRDCELCLDSFRLDLLRNIEMLMTFEKGV